MSIKIIQNTLTDPIEIKCCNCESILSYTYDDIQRDIDTGWFGMARVIRRYIVCPVCKSDIPLNPIAEVVKENDHETN